MKVLQVEDDLVLPHAPTLRTWSFATLREHQPRGRRARVVEVPDASPRGLARAELGGPPATPADEELEGHLAAYVLGEFAWLQKVPEGSEVRISPKGHMACRVTSEHMDYHRESSRDWARKQRRGGFLPLLVVDGLRVRVVALPWRGRAVSVVDPAEVEALLPQYGVRRYTRVEIL